MRRLAPLLLLAALGACEEPYYGDVATAQYRPDDPRVVGPAAYRLQMTPYGVVSPQPVIKPRTLVGALQVMQQDLENWNRPGPQPGPAQPFAGPVEAPPAAAAVAPEVTAGDGTVLPLAQPGAPSVQALPPIAAPAR